MSFSTFLDTWDRGYIEASRLMCLLQWLLYCRVLSAQLFARHRKLEVNYNKQYKYVRIKADVYITVSCSDQLNLNI